MPGDLIMTGTPAGVGEVQVGDTVSIRCCDDDGSGEHNGSSSSGGGDVTTNDNATLLSLHCEFKMGEAEKEWDNNHLIDW